MPASRCLLPVLFILLGGIIPPLSAAEPGDLATVQQDGNIVDLLTHDKTHFRISFLEADLFRLQVTRTGEFTGEGSEKATIVLDNQYPEIMVQVQDHGSHYSIKTEQLEIVVHVSPLKLELLNRETGKILWQELKPLSFSEGTTIQTLSSDVREHFFGGGQQNGTFQFKGRLMEISYSGGWEEGDRPSPAPFYMSDRGYGVLRNTWSDGQYDFRSDRYLTTAHSESRFDAYYMVGPTIHEVLDHYTRLTGRAGLLPRWAFEYGDADCYNDGDNVEKPGTVPEGWSDGPTGTTMDVVVSVAEQYRRHDMPGGWILPNDGYGCGYEDLPEVVSRLQELGFHTGLWTENGVEKIAWEIGVAGTRVQKLDVAWTGKGYQWALDANSDAARGFLDNSNSRPFIWTVMGWAGIQRYAVTWTGDQSGSWDYIRWHVPTLIGSGLSGMNYSTGDVDGIFGGSAETFTRDLQWKCFTSVFMGMSGWSKTERKHPWWFDEPYRSINRKYMKLRQRLMPYIYTLARETETTGAPMVRSVHWDHRADPHAFDYPNQFFLGRDLLVAPVFRSQSASGGWRRDIYLPKGRWIDYWNGSVVDAAEGGKVIDVPVDLGTLPVMVRAGAIIPMYPESLFDGQVPADPLTLDIYPHGQSKFEIYEDDGNTRDYKEGAFSRQLVSVDEAKNGGGITITLGEARGNFEGQILQRKLVFILHTRVQPESVVLDGENLNPFGSRKNFDAALRGWFFDPADRFGTIFVKSGSLNMDRQHQVAVLIDPGKDITETDSYDHAPEGDGTIGPDDLMVVGRCAEEPGHPLENAFDGNPDTWWRTVRDQSVAYGPHEFTLSLGGRRVIEGFSIRPRNDKYWKYGQVRDYEVYMADVNGQWGPPVAAGVLEQTKSEQVVRFEPRAGRLLRFRVLSTHDGADPMVLGAAELKGKAFDALAEKPVGPATISEFRIFERRAPKTPARTLFLADEITTGKRSVRMNDLQFENGLKFKGNSRVDFELNGDWQQFRAEVGLDDSGSNDGTVRFQVWGNGRLLWDSGSISSHAIIKPRLDIRGVSTLSLRTVATNSKVLVNWAEASIAGFEGDGIQPASGLTEH